MAMSLPISPATDAVPSSAQQHSNVESNTGNSLSTNNSSNNDTTTTTNDHPSGQSQNLAPKRKPSRRANTAERRATHNAVERQRRETLNGRFLDLASLLPNLSQVRRPSKSSIVNSSIAHIQASRRHRLVASRELKMLKLEGDALRRELNEWRDRAGLPRVEEPVRSDGFSMVLAGELEVIQGVAIEEEDEDAEDGFGVGLAMGAMPGMPHHPQQPVTGYLAPYMEEVDEDVGMLSSIYPQQPGGIHHHGVHHATQHQIIRQHPVMAHPHELEDPRMAAMFLKNTTPITHNISPSMGSPTIYESCSSAYPSNSGATNWVPSQVPGFGQTHLYTPPTTSHGLPTGNNSGSCSPVDGVSVNGANAGSPSSTSSSLAGSPLSIVPSHHSFGMRRERSGSLTSGNSPGGRSPVYELHSVHAAAMQDYTAMPRMGGGPAHFVPSHHHAHGLGMQVPQAITVGGGMNGAMMMMI
jgi:hypothetical protein